MTADRTRSRTGCQQCRLCDEVRPTCGRCTAKDIQCNFDRAFGVKHGNRPRRLALPSGSGNNDSSMSPRSHRSISQNSQQPFLEAEHSSDYEHSLDIDQSITDIPHASSSTHSNNIDT
ncbi:uncharacterized protein L201_003831 [Kwoniella dendrophila CBS 6074]|uniref:Zn(2)-C6 fungal-type domain-containing protein n=1 Tax=Kwoniella dendrophila CBS 6074 TaxID=1295534 RepID=A0AAX4JTZ7_9TREE